MLKKIFFEMFMCLLLKGYNKDHRIESVIWLHSKLFIRYIIYSNKPRKRYILDTRFLLTKIPVIFTTLISSFTWVVFGLFTELGRWNCWLSQYVSCYSFFFVFFTQLKMLLLPFCENDCRVRGTVQSWHH